MGGVGVKRFSAAANHSSLKERIFEPSGAEIKSNKLLAHRQAQCRVAISFTCVSRFEGRVNLINRNAARA